MGNAYAIGSLTVGDVARKWLVGVDPEFLFGKLKQRAVLPKSILVAIRSVV
jgi:hypothetical protein